MARRTSPAIAAHGVVDLARMACDREVPVDPLRRDSSRAVVTSEPGVEGGPSATVVREIRFGRGVL